MLSYLSEELIVRTLNFSGGVTERLRLSVAKSLVRREALSDHGRESIFQLPQGRGASD
jgi:hypothetical protein